MDKRKEEGTGVGLKDRGNERDKDSIDYFNLPIQQRIRRLEAGYLTDPEVETSKTLVRRNLVLDLEAVQNFELSQKRHVSDCFKARNDHADYVDSMVRQTSNNSIVSNTTIEGSTEPLMPDSPDPEIQIRIKTSNTIGKLLNDNNKGINTLDPIDLIDKSDSSTTALGTTIVGVFNPERSKQCGEENMVLVSTATGNGTIVPDTSEVGLHNKANKLQYVEQSLISPSTCLVAECNLHLGEIIADKSSRLTGQKWPNYLNSRCNTTC